MTARIRRPLVRLARWYLTPTGLAYVVAVGAAVVIAIVVSATWGVLALSAVVGVAIPFKLAQLESGRIELSARVGEHQRATERSIAERIAAVDERLAALDATVATAQQAAAALEPRLQQVAEAAADRAQTARRDAVAAIDSARHEWVELLRAERRRVDARLDRLGDEKASATEPRHEREPSSP